jgi:glyoxylase-like metal-dependent hydrolase (beta-lactamase superfamily II)
MACERIHLMTVGFEFVPRSWTLEGETDESPIRLPLTSLLARSDGRWLLFDTGLGPEFRDPEFSRRWYQWGDPELPGEQEDPLLDQLGRCGVSIDEIDCLVMSHLHVDHTGGIRRFADGRPVYIQGPELAFGLSDAAEPAQYRPHYDDPNIAWQRLDGDAEIAEGIRAISTPGHAPGHMAYVLDSGEDRIVFCGDVFHVPAAQFARPELTWGYDLDQSIARATRINLLREAAKTQAWLAGAHMAKPGIGRVVEDGSGFALRPIA